METITQIINNTVNELANKELLTERAAELLIRLSALLGNLNDTILQSDIAYNRILLKYLEEEKKANRARIKANITPEYELMKKAKNAEKVVLEIIRNLKYFLREKENEKRQSGNL